LTRQSIFLEKTDPRVKPAGDVEETDPRVKPAGDVEEMDPRVSSPRATWKRAGARLASI